ncbi:MAG: hypothetical protein JRJ70_15935 [Deltaproteobacteria bacterium]|nr:hypothetical protein [Deltaproteobacteria bacterium]
MDEITRRKKEGSVWIKFAAGYDARTLKAFGEAYERSIQKMCELLSPPFYNLLKLKRLF